MKLVPDGIMIIVASIIVASVNAVLYAQAVKSPPQAEWEKASADIAGTDETARRAAVAKVKGWIDGGWVSSDLWRRWLPALSKAGKQEEVADLAFRGVLKRPGPDGIVPLMEFRVKALLALGKKEEGLEAAKSYYNVCPIKGTAGAVELVGLALAKAHPEDGEVVRRFKGEQADAANGKGVPQPGEAMLNKVQVGKGAYDEALGKLAGLTRFRDRVGYGHLLLASDRGAEAEALFKELFQLASTQEELTQAAEGVAKALRAQDGHVARANAWLVKVQGMGTETKEGAATAPSKALEGIP